MTFAAVQLNIHLTTCFSTIFRFPTIVIRQTVKHVARQREEAFFSVDTFGST